jgi:hypothetical protein
MKKVFIISLPGVENKLLVADKQEEAFERRGEVDHSYEYLPVTVEELQIEGFEIFAKPKKEEKQEVLLPEVPETPEILVEKPPEEKASKSKAQKPKQNKQQSKK